MHEFSRLLGDSVKRARGREGLTQNEVADLASVDVRTVLNIENYKGNPKLEVLYPLVRVLRIDSREIFNPEMQLKSPAHHRLRTMIDDLCDVEAELLIPVLQSMILVLRSEKYTKIE